VAGGGTTSGAGAGAQAGTLANTGAGVHQAAGGLPPAAAGGVLAGLIALLTAAWLKRRELFGRSAR
jgi:hypothetical protein